MSQEQEEQQDHEKERAKQNAVAANRLAFPAHGLVEVSGTVPYVIGREGHVARQYKSWSSIIAPVTIMTDSVYGQPHPLPRMIGV